ncbi:protein SGT1 homolog [Typha latifolia]|uniref:protein SGT1 homolog n=1 Tax=Typha latifolia TaxID=4733 RepID=UPI003C2B7C70
MASDLEKKAKEAFVDDDFELAVDLYTQAIEMEPENADLYADRAQANIKLGSLTEAVADANKAIELDSSMLKAYLRKGIACIKLEEYQTAKTALEVGYSLSPGEKRFLQLMKECDEHLAEEDDDVVERKTDAPSDGTSVVDIAQKSERSGSEHDSLYHPKVEAPPKAKYRHDYYNTPTEVVLTIFAKGIPAEYVNVEFGEQILSLSIDIPGEEGYHFQPRLFGKIIPETCKYQVLSSKIEVRLSKAEAVAWTSLEYSNMKPLPQRVNVSSVVKPQRATYPSSKGNVDWDKLEAQVKKEEKDEKLDGDAALNKLFRDIYKDADEDMRRAMMKSFVESNGTVLSTNWKEVGSKKVDSTPPDGMELKKWEY